MGTVPVTPWESDWWRGAVIYQIYPRSFQDSNNDGIGDLAGIRHRLEHIAELGADAIWISPFFRSPMRDFGYDVSDYRDIDPMFGTLAEFDALIARAHDLGLKVLIDLVLSHTSDQHPWFIESRAGEENPKSDWYVWSDPKPDGSPPNNWLSVFGGSAWQWDGVRMQYYLHNFLAEQPDLNFHNEDVQTEILEIAKFWLERGVDGFRLDTVNYYFHDQRLRDNPPLDPELRNDISAPSVNPYGFQDHLYDKSQPENLQFLRRLRALVDQYQDRTMVGEIGESQRSIELKAQYTSNGDKLHMCYDFELLSGQPATGRFFESVLSQANDTLSDGWACWALSNHDVPRHPTRWNLCEQATKTYAALLLSLRGSVCLYQGEELGYREAQIAFEDLQDPYGRQFWPRFKGRDGCRTPIAWDRDLPQGGFTEGTPWLPVWPDHLKQAAALQLNDDNSIFAFYRDTIAFRKAYPALVRGSLTIVEARDDMISFVREHDAKKVFCAFNLSEAEVKIELPTGVWENCGDSPFKDCSCLDRQSLPAWCGIFASQSNGDF